MSMESGAVQEAAGPAESRRGFHLKVIFGLWGLISAALAAPAAIYLLTPPRTRREAEWVEAADLKQLPTGTPEEVVFRQNRVDGWKVTSEKTAAWVVKKSESEVVAYAPQCTHLGCAYHWSERRKVFVCPCHTSAFSIDGKVLEGPAQRPLDRFDVRVHGGKLWISPQRKLEGKA